MGETKETTTTTQTTTPTPTREERELNRLALQRAQAAQQGLIGTQAAGLDLSQLLLRGGELPGFFGGLARGITPQMAGEFAQEAIQDILPSFQQAGILASGPAASIAARTAGDIRRRAAESNISRRMNLLKMALGGQAQVQQPILGQEAVLSGRLAGLRKTTTTGEQVFTGPSPFFTSFQQALGGFPGRIAGRFGADPFIGFGVGG